MQGLARSQLSARIPVLTLTSNTILLSSYTLNKMDVLGTPSPVAQFTKSWFPLRSCTLANAVWRYALLSSKLSPMFGEGLLYALPT